nr:hypothetical protein [Tanacetum cinerariifolium]
MAPGGGYQAHVAEYQKYLEEERIKVEGKAVPEPPKGKVTKPKVSKPASDTAPKPTSSQPSKPTPAPTEYTKIVQGKKRKVVKETSDAPSLAKRLKPGKVTKYRMSKSTLKLVDEFVDEGIPVKEPAYLDEEADIQRALELSLKEQEERTQGPARLMVIRETESGKFQPLLEVQRKGKEKVTNEQAAHDLLTLQTPKKKTPAEQFIFQMRTTMITGPFGDDKSLSLDAEPELTYRQGGSGLGKAEVMKTIEAEQTTEEQIREEFTSTMYPNVQDTFKLPFEEQIILEEHASFTRTLTHAEAKVESMVTVTIQQDTSSVPPMQFKVVDLPKPRPNDANFHSPPPSTTLVGRQNRGQRNNEWGAGAASYGGAQNGVGYANPGQARQIKCYNYNGGQDNDVDEDVDEQPVLDLALNVDNVFQSDNCDAFDSDVNEAPIAQTMFMANLSSADPVYD